MIRILLPSLAAFMLASCSSIPKIDEDSKSQLWFEHQTAITGINIWNLNGRLGVKDQKNSGTLNFLWEQSYADYELRFIGPLGQGTYILKNTTDGIVMHSPKNKITTANTIAELFHNALGWKLNIDGLKYWVRGIPEPDMSYTELKLDEKGRLIRMKQSGFSVNVSGYVVQNGISLPKKIAIKNDNMRLKLVIKKWKTHLDG